MRVSKAGLAAVFALVILSGATSRAQISLTRGSLTFSANPLGFRYSFSVSGKPIVSADAHAGLTLNGRAVSIDPGSTCASSPCVLAASNQDGQKLKITITLEQHHAILEVIPARSGAEVRFMSAGATPAYGLADHAIEQKRFSTLPSKRFDTDVTGFADDAFASGQGLTRLVSNFLIYPKQHFAEVLIDPFAKIVHTSREQIVQGVVHAQARVALHYFFGTPHEIYAAYLKARNDSGYKVMVPKYEAFGVGWEAFGALGWDTNQQTVRSSVDRYLQEGYPLRWIVIGSGFWPAPPEMHETTSFGLWDKAKYPDPRGLLQHFHDEKLKNLLGLRITFITSGPFSKEGAEKGYFFARNGSPQAFTGGWPKLPYYVLDAHNPTALAWYMNLVKRWQDFGVDGFKEDYYGYEGHSIRDDKVDPVNDSLMEEGQYVIERNGYLSSNGDLHRINDFNYDQPQDRGPVNALALAYSGFPLVYPDIVGGTFGENHFKTTRTARMETYMMRNARWASLHSSMGMGEPPWTFSPAVQRVMLDSARLHARIAPYLFSQARKFAADGFPWTMTPLPLAFPDDAHVYGRENEEIRGYEWLIGDALLATPLYGDDYATAGTRDIYLPAGQWMDFDSGKIYPGDRLLKGFPLPPEKTPLFVGGSGVVLEDLGDGPQVVIYPVAFTGDVTLTLPESEKPFHVRLQGLAPGLSWSGIRVTDVTRNEQVAVQSAGKGFAFRPIPDHNYRVVAVGIPN